MKNKILSFLSILLIVVLGTSPVSAGPGIRLSGVQFSLGSLIADGYVAGLGRTDVTVVLTATGEPVEVFCINNGGAVVPGHSSPRIDTVGVDNLAGNDASRKNGKAPFTAETSDFLPWYLAGCPGSNWVGQLGFVDWTEATLTVHLGFNNPTGEELARQDYTCETTRDADGVGSVSCTPIPAP